MQHAWGIATHDLIYKGQSVNWGRARVAFQIKAMLEHAEVSIESVDSIAGSSLLRQTNDKYHGIRQIIAWLDSTWDGDALPADRVRLAQNILTITKALNITIEEVIASVNSDTSKGEGAALRDLTPYSVVIRAIYNNHNGKFVHFSKKEGGKFKMFLSDQSEFSDQVRSIPGARPEKFIYLTQSMPIHDSE